MTKSDKYKLTPAGKKLFQVLINPEHVGKNVDKLCKIADVSRDTYYRLMKEQEFTDLVSETSREMVMAKMGDVLNATYVYALGEKGHQDRKLLLTMAGLYTEKQELSHTGEITQNHNMTNLSEDELRKLANLGDD